MENSRKNLQNFCFFQRVISKENKSALGLDA